MENLRICSINCLQPNQNNAFIKVKVVRQGIRISARSNSKPIRKVILVDEEGTKIHGIMFSNTTDLFQDQLKINKTYIISNATVREVNNNYPNVNKHIELIFQTNTTIDELETQFTCSNVTSGFTTFDDVGKESYTDEDIDVIGILKKVRQLHQFQKKDMSMGYRREIILINPSLETMTINLWDDLAMNEGLFLQEIEMDKPVIAFCNLKRHIFEGMIQLKSTAVTTMFTNPSCIEKEKINIWLNNSLKEQSLEELWMIHQIKDADEISLTQILNQKNTLQQNKSYRFKAYIREIENKANPWYEACSNCFKSINKTMDKPSCNNCIGFNINVVPRYRVTMTIEDGTETARVTLFESVANVFIGCGVKQYIDSVIEDNETSIYYKVLDAPNKDEYKFLFKMDKNVEIRNGVLALVIEAIQNPSQSFSSTNIARKQRSPDFEQQKSKKKRGRPTKISINQDKEIQVIEDDAGAGNKIEDYEKIATLARKKTEQPNNKKRRGRPTKESKNKDMKIHIIDDDINLRMDIDDDENLASFKGKKKKMTKEKFVKQTKVMKIKEEKI